MRSIRMGTAGPQWRGGVAACALLLTVSACSDEVDLGVDDSAFTFVLSATEEVTRVGATLAVSEYDFARRSLVGDDCDFLIYELETVTLDGSGATQTSGSPSMPAGFMQFTESRQGGRSFSCSNIFVAQFEVGGRVYDLAGEVILDNLPQTQVNQAPFASGAWSDSEGGGGGFEFYAFRF